MIDCKFFLLFLCLVVCKDLCYGTHIFQTQNGGLCIYIHWKPVCIKQAIKNWCLCLLDAWFPLDRGLNGLMNFFSQEKGHN